MRLVVVDGNRDDVARRDPLCAVLPSVVETGPPPPHPRVKATATPIIANRLIAKAVRASPLVPRVKEVGGSNPLKLESRNRGALDVVKPAHPLCVDSLRTLLVKGHADTARTVPT